MSNEHWLQVLGVVGVLGTCGCRIEPRRPTDRVPVASALDAGEQDASVTGDDAENSAETGSSASSEEDASSQGDGGHAVEDDEGDPDGMDAGGAGPGDAALREGGSQICRAPGVDGCNPVTNEGCSAELGMHCVIDPVAESLAGYCIFSAPMDAGGCLNTFVTESCPPRSTCLDDACRTLCFCDEDCEQGECCAEPAGSLGFKVCGKC